MKLYGDRQTGRTTVLINCMRNDIKGILAVHNQNEKKRLIFSFSELRGRVFTYEELKRRPGDIFRDEYHIYLDNADFCNIEEFKYPVFMEVR